jgi:hypothetical protein
VFNKIKNRPFIIFEPRTTKSRHATQPPHTIAHNTGCGISKGTLTLKSLSAYFQSDFFEEFMGTTTWLCFAVFRDFFSVFSFVYYFYFKHNALFAV